MKHHFLTTFYAVAVFSVFLFFGTPTQAQVVFHVNSETGNDVAGDGSISAPWATPEKARDEIRAWRKDKAFPEKGFVVELTGTFPYPEKTLNFTAEDSGQSADAPMIYRASEKGALFVGGNQLKKENFKKVSDPATLARLKDGAREEIYEIDLSSAGIANIEPLPDKFQRWPSVELFSDGTAMQIARFPNTGWLEIPKVIDRGVAPIDRSKDEWEFGVRPAIFEYSEEEPARWDASKGIWLTGFWCHDWFCETIKLGKIDVEKKQFTTAVNSVYGIGNSSEWHTAKRRYFVFNLLEELDRPGEWYIDNEKNILYFYPIDGKLDDVFLAVQKQPIISVKQAKFFTLSGIEAKCTVGHAVLMENCEDSLMTKLRVYNTTNNAINLTGGARNGLTHSEVFNAGSACVTLYGGNRKTLEKCDNYVTNCHLHHSGRLQRTGGTCLSFHGCGCYVAHNLLHDSPYICINYGGNEHLFEYNEVHSAMMESGDGGGMYTGRDWGSLGNVIQYNYFHHFGQAGVDWQKENGLNPNYEPLKENVMVMGVYLDDCDSGDTVRNNIFYRAGWATFVGGGRYNNVHDNLYIECTAAVHFDDRGLKRAKPGEGYKNGWDLLQKLKDLDFDKSPWKERYPFIQNVMEDEPKLPLHNTVHRNTAIACQKWVQHHQYVGEPFLHRIDFTDNNVFNFETTQQDLFPLNPEGTVRAAFREEKVSVENPESDGFRDIQQQLKKLIPTYQVISIDRIGLEK